MGGARKPSGIGAAVQYIWPSRLVLLEPFVVSRSFQSLAKIEKGNTVNRMASVAKTNTVPRVRVRVKGVALAGGSISPFVSFRGFQPAFVARNCAQPPHCGSKKRNFCANVTRHPETLIS